MTNQKKEKTDFKLLLRIQPDISFLLEINNLHLTMAIFLFFLWKHRFGPEETL